MSKLRVLLVTLAVVALLLLPTVASAQPNVCGFYGSVSADGAAVADGTTVKAWVDSVEVKSVTTNGSDYVMAVDGNFAGKTVEFTVVDAAGTELAVGESALWEAGANKMLDLAAFSEAVGVATISLSPSSGLYTAISGTGFTPNSAVDVTFDGESVANVTADMSGSFAAFVVSPITTAGTYTIAATDAAGRTDEASFEVTETTSGTSGSGITSIVVNTLEPGASATAEIDDAGVLTLGIPAGTAGADGTNGTNGVDGDDGDDGSPVLGIVAIIIAVIAIILVFVLKPKAPAAA